MATIQDYQEILDFMVRISTEEAGEPLLEPLPIPDLWEGLNDPLAQLLSVAIRFIKKQKKLATNDPQAIIALHGDAIDQIDFSSLPDLPGDDGILKRKYELAGKRCAEMFRLYLRDARPTYYAEFAEKMNWPPLAD